MIVVEGLVSFSCPRTGLVTPLREIWEVKLSTSLHNFSLVWKHLYLFLLPLSFWNSERPLKLFSSYSNLLTASLSWELELPSCFYMLLFWTYLPRPWLPCPPGTELTEMPFKIKRCNDAHFICEMVGHTGACTLMGVAVWPLTMEMSPVEQKAKGCFAAILAGDFIKMAAIWLPSSLQIIKVSQMPCDFTT